jgi:hypothetical protein
MIKSFLCLQMNACRLDKGLLLFQGRLKIQVLLREQVQSTRVNALSTTRVALIRILTQTSIRVLLRENVSLLAAFIG